MRLSIPAGGGEEVDLVTISFRSFNRFEFSILWLSWLARGLFAFWKDDDMFCLDVFFIKIFCKQYEDQLEIFIDKSY